MSNPSCIDQTPSSGTLKLPSSACRRSLAAELVWAFIYGEEASDARVEAQRRRKAFQMTYQPSCYFHTGLLSQHEGSNKVRHPLICLRAVAVTWSICSLSV